MKKLILFLCCTAASLALSAKISTTNTDTCRVNATIIASPSDTICGGAVFTETTTSHNTEVLIGLTTSVLLTAQGGVVYLWNNGTTTDTLRVSGQGQYKVTVTDSSGCTSADSITVYVYPPMNISMFTNLESNSLCSVVTTSPSPQIALFVAQITAPGSVQANYIWTITGGGLQMPMMEGSIFNETGVFFPNLTLGGTVAVTVNIPSFPPGNPYPCPKRDSIQVTGCPCSTIMATLAANATTPSLCQGDSTTLNASGAATYSWAPSSGLSATTGAIITATPTVTTTYTVTGSTAAGYSTTCTGTYTVTVTVNPTPAIVIMPSASTICSGSSATLTASGAATYLWNDGETTSAIMVSPTATATYSVTGTSAQGCTEKASQAITVNSSPTISVTPAYATINSGNAVPIVASGGNTYSWSPATALSATTGANVTATPVLSTTYTVIGTSTDGCSATQAVALTVSATPVIFINPPAATICAGGTVTLHAIGGHSYTWNTGHAGATYNVSPATTTTYTITGTVGTSIVSQAVTITVNPMPVLAVTPSSASICTGGSTNLIASGANTYSWSPSIGLSSTDSAGVAANPTSTTNYTVTGTSIFGCVSTDKVKVTVNSLPNIQITGKDTLCSGDSIKLTATGAGTAGTYLWSDGTTNNTDEISPASNMNYLVTGTNSNGCSNSATKNIVVNPTPIIIITPTNNPLCNGNMAVLTVSGANTYKWSTSSTNDTIIVSPNATHTYTVSGTNSYGCTNKASQIITVNNCQGISCSNPIAFDSSNMCLNNQILPGNNAWYSFIVQNKTTEIYFHGLNTLSTLNQVQKIYLYKTCASTPLDSGTIYNDSIIVFVDTTLIIGKTYFLELIPNHSVCSDCNLNGSAQYDLCLRNPHKVENEDQAMCAIDNTSNTNGCCLPGGSNPPPCYLNVCVGDNITWEDSYDLSGPLYFTFSPNTPANTSPSLTDGWYSTTTAYYTSPGTYTAFVTDPSGGISALMTINVEPPPTASISNPSTVCVGQPVCVIANYGGFTSGTGDNVTLIPGNGQQFIYGPLIALYDEEISSSGSCNTVTYSSSGVFDMSLSITNSCGMATATSTITVVDPPAITITPNPIRLCPSPATTNVTIYTEGPGFSYSWSPSTGVSPSSGTYAASSGNTIIPEQFTTPGVYTITVTDDFSGGNNCPSTATVTVNPGITITMTSLPSCAGSSNGSATATASDGVSPYSYSWSDGQTTSTAINLSPGTYTITVTDATGCSSSATVTVGKIPNPFIGISPSSASICTGGSVTLTASGATTYTWTPALGLNTTSGPTVIASPTSNTTYIVTGIGALGCESTQKAIITVNPSCCGTNCDAMLNSTTETGGFSISSIPASSLGTSVTFTAPTCVESSTNTAVSIQGVFTVDVNCTFSNCNIAMAPGSQIIVQSGVTLTIDQARLYACRTMWNGIIVQAGGILNVTNGSIIEDAITGIEGQNTAGSISVDNSTLNNNYQDIVIDPSSGIYPLTLNGATLITEKDPPFSYTGSLKAPHAGINTYEGIYLNNANANIGSTSLAINNFNTLQFGVYAVNSNFTVTNNDFSNFYGNPFVCYPTPCYKGIAIDAISPGFVYGTTSTYNTTAITLNNFNQCWRGVDVTDYVSHNVSNNIFSNTIDNLGSNLGDHAIFIKPVTTLQMELNNNSITNYLTAIHIDGITPGLYGQFANIDINSNNIGVSGTGAMNYGIEAENIHGNTSETSTVATNIEYNQVNSAISACIYLNNFLNEETYVTDNPLLHIQPPSLTSTTIKAGIFLNNCVISNPFGVIYVTRNADIDASGTTLSSIANKPDVTVLGIYANLSSGKLFYVCNTIFDVGQCMRFTGNCTGSNIFSNDFTTAGTNCYDGLTLYSNGKVGSQGGISEPMGNVWNNGTFLHSQTYTFNTKTPGKYSPFWLQSTSAQYWPYTNLTNGTPLTDDYNEVITYRALNLATSGNALGCANFKRSTHLSSNDSIAAIQQQMDLVVEDSIGYSVFIPQATYLGKQDVFNQLSSDSSLMGGDSILSTFYAQTVNTCMGGMYSVQQQIQSGNYSIAQTINNGLIPQCTIEQNQIALNNIFFSTLAIGIDTLTGTQADALENIAYQCPLTGGRAVSEARHMLNFFLNTSIVFNDSCIDNGQNNRAIKQQVNNSISAKVYPNPANSLLNVEIQLGEDQIANICLYSADGQKVICEELDKNLSRLSISNLSSGIYFYRITDQNGKLINADKVMIIH